MLHPVRWVRSVLLYNRISPMTEPTTAFRTLPNWTFQRPRRSKLRLCLRATLLVLALLCLFCGAAYLWFRSAANAALPQLDGAIEIEGLSSPVSVIRDAQGVPNIRAANMEDLLVAQGYVTAQDRLWEMDTMRRYAAGELAAGLGSDFVELDKKQRTLGLRQVADRAAANLSPRDRAFLEAYARGVNAYIADHQHSLPLEFRLARYSPVAWTPTDSFLVGAAMAEGLNNYSYAHELGREKVLAKLGPELTADLYVNNSFRDIPPSGDGQELTGGSDQAPAATDAPNDNAEPSRRPRRAQRAHHPRRQQHPPVRRRPRRHRAAMAVPGLSTTPLDSAKLDFSAYDFLEPIAEGSNNWVLSGEHTASGKPLLSNDMHLRHQLPNVWYEAHLTAGDFDVAGVTLPGAPFVVVGHNRRIAWGFTNLGPDVEDVFIETFNERGEYLTPEGWKSPDVRHETIRVKNGRDVSFDVLVTRHGPLITPPDKNDKRKLALKWVIYDPQALTFPFFDLNSAKNWQEFRAAFSHFGTPGQNVVYADVDGHIGYQATGLVPTRSSGDGSLPVNGSDDQHEWTGYIPFDQLPSVFDPPSGLLATANARITPDGYPNSISTEWVAPYRTERIYRVLRQDRKFTSADMLALQMDVQSEIDRYVAERVVYAAERSPKTSDRARKAVDLLRKWDGRLLADSAPAAIAVVSRQKLTRLILEAKLGKDSKDYEWFRQPVWLENALLFQQPRWLPPQFKDYDELLTAALEDAVRDPQAPSDLSSWKYGDTFPVEIRHDFFGKMPFLRRYAGPGVQPQSGGGQTVKQVGRNFGPSERLTVDFSNFDSSTLNIVNGQSDHLFSRHFNDQWQAWYTGTTFPLPFSQDAVEKARVNDLTLMPVRR